MHPPSALFSLARSLARAQLLLPLLLALLLLPLRARAEPPLADDEDPDVIEQRSEAEALPRGSNLLDTHAPVRLSLSGWRQARSDGRLDLGAGALLSLPLDKLSRPALPHPASREALASPSESEREAPLKLERQAKEREALRSPAALKQLVKAALRVARLSDDRHLASMSARARGSGAMPELRLRVVRSSDASARLTSTETDAVRTQASGGASMLYEARATWRLDRLIFSDDEIAIERLRQERAAQRRRLLHELTEAITTWLRATERANDSSSTIEEQSEALARQAAASIALDAMTGGAWSELQGQ